MIYALLVSYCIMINASPVICRVSELGVVFISELICLDTVAESFLHLNGVSPFTFSEREIENDDLSWLDVCSILLLLTDRMVLFNLAICDNQQVILRSVIFLDTKRTH